MIENTLENKAKFFALYLNRKECIIRQGYINRDNVKPNGVDEYDSLELKHLSSITDEDAIEVKKIASSEKDVEILFNTISREKALFECKYTTQYNKHYEVVDYLRSRGYALPYRGASIETMVEWRWIKLKED